MLDSREGGGGCPESQFLARKSLMDDPYFEILSAIVVNKLTMTGIAYIVSAKVPIRAKLSPLLFCEM